MDLKNVLKKPIITEKSNLAINLNRYVFEVDKKAGKKEVSRAIKEFFNVKVQKVRIINLQKEKRAVIQLAEGEKIDLFQSGE